MGLVFNDLTKIILIEAPQVVITCQELIDAIRTWEAQWYGIDDNSVANASGKEDLGGGKYVGITLELLDSWRIQFEARGSPTFCTVTGGNFVPSYSGTMPIVYSTNVMVIVELDTSAALLDAGASQRDWTDSELSQIRYVLGIDGTKLLASGGVIQVMQTHLERILGLSQENFRIKDQVYASFGPNAVKRLTQATYRIYGSASDCQSDINPIGEYTMAASYNAEGNCTGFQVIKI